MNEQRIFEVIYIRTTLAALWNALTNPDVTVRYWGGSRIESDWKPGSTIRYVRDGQVADEHTILAVEPLRLLRHTFRPLFGEFAAEAPSEVTMRLRASGDVVRLTVDHAGFPPDSRVYRACCDGWPLILSGLKTLLETGAPLPPFELEPPGERFTRPAGESRG